MVISKRVKQWATEKMKGMEHLIYKERLINLGLLIPGEGRAGENFNNICLIVGAGRRAVKKIKVEPDAS